MGESLTYSHHTETAVSPLLFEAWSRWFSYFTLFRFKSSGDDPQKTLHLSNLAFSPFMHPLSLLSERSYRMECVDISRDPAECLDVQPPSLHKSDWLSWTNKIPSCSLFPPVGLLSAFSQWLLVDSSALGYVYRCAALFSPWQNVSQCFPAML